MSDKCPILMVGVHLWDREGVPTSGKCPVLEGVCLWQVFTYGYFSVMAVSAHMRGVLLAGVSLNCI